MSKAQTNRRATIERTTSETQVKVELVLDGTGRGQIQTTIPFLDHMLTLLAKHGFFDLTVQAKGDTDIDDHHTIEDVGIVLGDALKQALGSKEGIRRFGWASIPLDETLAQVTVDLSGRPYLVYHIALPQRRIKTFDLGLFEDFFQAFTTHAAQSRHVCLRYARNRHLHLEAVFKALAEALAQATGLDRRVSGVPSTKGRL